MIHKYTCERVAHDKVVDEAMINYMVVSDIWRGEC